MKKALTKLIPQRARNCCEYCLLPDSVSTMLFQIDHIISQQHGGLTKQENLAYSCTACNKFKGSNIASLDPDRVTDQPIMLFNPRKDDWHDHFRLEGSVIVGKTDRGRATVFILQFNNKIHKQVRALLIEEGLYPPSHFLR